MIVRDWNTVICVRPEGYSRARRLLQRFGPIGRTDFYNVLVMDVADRTVFLDALRETAADQPARFESIARIMPASECFDFTTASDLDERTGVAVAPFVPALGSKRFHVRAHLRGLEGGRTNLEEERALGQVLLTALQAAGTPGRVAFDDPDAIVALETVGHRAGLALWSREDLQRYPFLRLD